MSQELQTQREGNTLLVPIEIRQTDLKKIEEMISKLRQLEHELPEGIPLTARRTTRPETEEIDDEEFAKKIQRALRSKDPARRLRDLLGEDLSDDDIKSMLEENAMVEFFQKQGLGTDDMSKFLLFLKSPAQGIMSILAANPIVTAALVGAMIIPVVFDWMSDRGRPWNRFFVRRVHEEGIIGRSRESRQQVKFGFKQTIFVTRSGKANVLIAFNSYNAVKTGEIEAIEAYQTRSGRLGP